MIYFNFYLISVIVRGVLRVLFVLEVLENVMILAVLVFASHFLILFQVVSYCLALSLHGVLFCRFLYNLTACRAKMRDPLCLAGAW